MKNKPLIVLPAIAASLCLVFGIAGCTGETHTHTYSDEWSYDETSHWHSATCEHTDEVSDYGEHTFSNIICSVCDYKLVETDGLEYTLSNDGTYYIVSGIGKATALHILIPSEYDEKPVKAIGEYAFAYCDSIISVTIPDSITYIGDGAFIDCTALTEINVDENNKYYCDIDGVLFSKDKTKLIAYPEGKTDTSYVIPDSVAYIGEYAFAYYTTLTSITIPDSVNSIGEYAFANCTSLTSVTIPDSVTKIGDGAFEYCTALTSVTIPDSVTEIGDGAFEYCTSLTSITIPDNVTYIDTWAFWYCTSLTSVTIGSGVISIGDYAFSDCTSLTSVTIGSGVISIGDYAFYNCTSLENITIPYSVTTIGYASFLNCSSLTKINVDENNRYFCDIDDVLFNIDKTELIAYPAGKTATSYTIPNGVTCIEYGAFAYCTALTSVTIPDSVTYIRHNAFEYCTSLTSVTIPDSVTYIGIWAFAYCTSLTSITIPDNVTYIGMWAFYGCASLKSVTFENTDGWRYTSGLSTANGTISSAELAVPATAAEYLTSTYATCYWKRT